MKLSVKFISSLSKEDINKILSDFLLIEVVDVHPDTTDDILKNTFVISVKDSDAKEILLKLSKIDSVEVAEQTPKRKLIKCKLL